MQSPALKGISNLFDDDKMTPAIPDVLTLTAANLKTLLEDGAVSTVHLVELYLAQIEQHSHHGAKLNAIISTARCTAVMELARQLDNERAQKKLRGPMHGIPIIIKVSRTRLATIDPINAFNTINVDAMLRRMCILHLRSGWRRLVDLLLLKVKLRQEMPLQWSS